MKKLKQGDCVTNLTEEQFDELIKIEGEIYVGILNFKKSFNHLLFDGLTLLHAYECFDPTTELPFEVFKERAINTFKG